MQLTYTCKKLINVHPSARVKVCKPWKRTLAFACIPVLSDQIYVYNSDTRNVFTSLKQNIVSLCFHVVANIFFQVRKKCDHPFGRNRGSQWDQTGLYGDG